VSLRKRDTAEALADDFRKSLPETEEVTVT